MKMKRIISSILALSICFLFISCSEKSVENNLQVFDYKNVTIFVIGTYPDFDYDTIFYEKIKKQCQISGEKQEITFYQDTLSTSYSWHKEARQHWFLIDTVTGILKDCNIKLYGCDYRKVPGHSGDDDYSVYTWYTLRISNLKPSNISPLTYYLPFAEYSKYLTLEGYFTCANSHTQLPNYNVKNINNAYIKLIFE
jgi:hypothetical protein